MKLQKMTELNTSREMVEVFKGYNHNLRIGSGEFYDMKNLTSSKYPVLSTRPKRGTYASPVSANGIIAKDALCYVDGADFVINEYRVNMGLSNTPKELISMGSYVIIMPDKMYINTMANESDGGFEFGKIEAIVTTNVENTVTFSLCRLDGEEYKNATTSPTQPETPKNMDLWIDTSSTPHTLKQYSAASDVWVTIATTYVKISSPGIGKPFSENDGVTISGVESASLASLNGTTIIWARGDDYIVVTGILDTQTTQEKPITVERKMPNMDFIVESENRLWGCKYGVALNGEVVNEIYASKLGDFKNWNCFAGISTDSYAASVGTDGQFTGAITHLGYPLFFKENCIHKVYGNYPANYQIQTTACRGVQKGCSKSLAIVNEVLYYKSQSAVCAYDGSLPVEVSDVLGDVSYSDAVSGAFGNKYYISMLDQSKHPHLFVYDTQRGMWHKEDNTKVRAFCPCRGNLYYIDDTLGIIKSVIGDSNIDVATTSWMAETGIIGVDSPDKKYISRLDVRMSLEIGARVAFYIQYDSNDEWEFLFAMSGTTLRSFPVPIRPKRCDHMRIRIDGYGEAKIFSLCKTIEQGSDI